jgi:hypothetical protein
MGNAAEQKPGLVDDGLGGLTYQVIGLAMAVHNDLGPGHREATYHNAMTQRFVDAGLAAEREPELPIVDENGNFGQRRLKWKRIFPPAHILAHRHKRWG